jgi:non-ribosomal peptide synthetase component E (peptide arylation enzyme)
MAMAKAYGRGPKINETDIVLNIISPVGGISSAFTYNGSAALVGAKVILLDIWNPQETLSLIEKEKATILLAVPAQLAKIVMIPSLKEYNLRSLRCVCTSTAPLSPSLATEIESKLGVPVLNYYGQFDAGLIAGVSIDDPPETRRTTVGKPLRENIVILQDDNGNEVPSGEIGEVVYTGPTAGSGYYKDLEITLSVWEHLGIEGRCHSGDLAKYDEKGNLVLVGRKKEVIIRGGQNIFPAEMEGLLLTSPKIESVAIVPMPDPIMGEKCCAYVALKKNCDFTYEEMVSFLKDKKIARYKIPERLEIRQQLPLKGHQKIAKEELRLDIIKKIDAEKSENEDDLKKTRISGK